RPEVADHDRERPLLPELALPKRLDGGRISRVAREVISADALDGEDRTETQPPGRCSHGLRPADLLAVRGQSVLRAAPRAGHGLRVEPAIARVVVFAAACLPHRPRAPRR